MVTPGEWSEDSGSHHAFFIGDDEINMAEDMPTSIRSFLELTELSHTQLTDPLLLLTNSQSIYHILDKWGRSLCLLLSQYTHQAGLPTSGTLRYINIVCPWRMNTGQQVKCRYLATMCVITGCCAPILDYEIAEQEIGHAYIIAVPSIGTIRREEVKLLTDIESSDELHETNREEESSSNTINSTTPRDSSVEELKLSNQDISCNIETVGQFISTFWFLMDVGELCTYLRQLESTNNVVKLKSYWERFMNCVTCEYG